MGIVFQSESLRLKGTWCDKNDNGYLVKELMI